MQITARYRLTEFTEKHTDSINAINRWAERVEQSEWKNHNDLKVDFPSADYVKNNRYVFNIKGNNYRLVVVVLFFAGECNVRFMGTHAEYDKIKDISTI